MLALVALGFALVATPAYLIFVSIVDSTVVQLDTLFAEKQVLYDRSRGLQTLMREVSLAETLVGIQAIRDWAVPNRTRTNASAALPNSKIIDSPFPTIAPRMLQTRVRHLAAQICDRPVVLADGQAVAVTISGGACSVEAGETIEMATDMAERRFISPRRVGVTRSSFSTAKMSTIWRGSAPAKLPRGNEFLFALKYRSARIDEEQCDGLAAGLLGQYRSAFLVAQIPWSAIHHPEALDQGRRLCENPK